MFESQDASFLIMCILGFFLCTVNCSHRMMRRRINRRQFQRTSADIDYIMPCSCRNKNAVPLTDFFLKIQIFLTITHFYHRHALLNPNQLVRILMDLQTDIRTCRDTHQCHLRITARPDFGTVICILRITLMTDKITAMAITSLITTNSISILETGRPPYIP